MELAMPAQRPASVALSPAFFISAHLDCAICWRQRRYRGSKSRGQCLARGQMIREG
jgi:hypothetical protein